MKMAMVVHHSCTRFSSSKTAAHAIGDVAGDTAGMNVIW
jgi:hypothetical protein